MLVFQKCFGLVIYHVGLLAEIWIILNDVFEIRLIGSWAGQGHLTHDPTQPVNNL